MNLRDLHQVVLALLAQDCGDYEVLVLPKLPSDDWPDGDFLSGLSWHLDHVNFEHGNDRYVVLVGELDNGQDVKAILAQGFEDKARGRHTNDDTDVHSGAGRLNGWGTRRATR